jgi:hypothetical protein
MKALTPSKWAAILALVGALVWYGLQVVRPVLPIAVQFRSAVGGSGFVLIFKNESDRALSFTATLRHPGQQEEKKFAIQVPPSSAYELGGWIGQSGDRISLTNSDYKVWTGALP